MYSVRKNTGKPVTAGRFEPIRGKLQSHLKLECNCLSKRTGGEGGIRTPGTLSGTPVFKTGAINHSATSPCAEYKRDRVLTRELFLVYMMPCIP